MSSGNFDDVILKQMRADAKKAEIHMMFAGQLFGAFMADLPHDVAHNVEVIRGRARFAKEASLFLMEEFGLAKVQVRDGNVEQ